MKEEIVIKKQNRMKQNKNQQNTQKLLLPGWDWSLFTLGVADWQESLPSEYGTCQVLLAAESLCCNLLSMEQGSIQKNQWGVNLKEYKASFVLN